VVEVGDRAGGACAEDDDHHRDAELDRIARERRALANRGLSWDAERARLRAEYDRVNAMPRIPDCRVAGEVLDPDGQPDTWGKRWNRMDDPARRRWLKSGRMSVFVGKDDAGQVKITREVLDDDE
jgi:hypothetical protein